MVNKCAEKAEQVCKSYPNCYGCNAFRNPTNYDKIKHMSIDEVADMIRCFVMCDTCPASNFCDTDVDCGETFKKWLESEAEE